MSESGKVVVTKSKLDGLANAINDKAQSPGPKTIAQLTQTVNDMKTDYAQDFVVKTVDQITSPATNKTVTLTKTNTEIRTAINAGKNVVLLVDLGGGLVGVARLETRTGVNAQVFRGRFANPGMVTVSAPIWYDFFGVPASDEGSNVMHYSYYTIGSPSIPIPSTSDNGKFLQVVNGAWAAAEIANANGGSF